MLQVTQDSLAENEEFLQTLQVAHDDLAGRCTRLEEDKADLEREKADLEREKADLVLERMKDAKILMEAEDETDAMASMLEEARNQISELANQKKELQEALEAASRQSGKSQALNQQLGLQLTEKEGVIADLRERLATKAYQVDSILVQVSAREVELEGLKVEKIQWLAYKNEVWRSVYLCARFDHG